MILLCVEIIFDSFLATSERFVGSSILRNEENGDDDHVSIGKKENTTIPQRVERMKIIPHRGYRHVRDISTWDEHDAVESAERNE